MKKTINTVLMFAAVVSAASIANAAPSRVDMYGASAQKDYWLEMGGDFMINEMGCVGADRATLAGDTNYTIVKGFNCNTLPLIDGSTTVHEDAYITYYSGASFEGVLAGAEKAPLPGNDANACAAASENKDRYVIDPTTCVFDNNWATTDSCTSRACNDIEMGTSDVYVTSFKQASDGYKKGHLNGGPYTVDLNDNTYSSLKAEIEEEINAGTLTVEYPTVVPFAFFVNPGVTGVTNLTRTQALNIYSNTLNSWDQVPSYTGTAGKGIVKCLRHAGSGTHSTLDMVVFRDDLGKPGTSLIQYDDSSLTGYTFFNFSSSDMKNCLAANGGHSDAYAVGYMDADQENKAPTQYRMLKYQGANPYAAEIQNGVYDFWSKQNIYMKGTNTFMTKMIDYAKVHVPANKATWWVSESSLNVTKSSDINIPENK